MGKEVNEANVEEIEKDGTIWVEVGIKGELRVLLSVESLREKLEASSSSPWRHSWTDGWGEERSGQEGGSGQLSLWNGDFIQEASRPQSFPHLHTSHSVSVQRCLQAR